MNLDPLNPKRRIVGYGYEGGLSLDAGCRPGKHSSVGRRNHRRKLTKRQRAAGRRDTTQDFSL